MNGRPTKREREICDCSREGRHGRGAGHESGTQGDVEEREKKEEEAVYSRSRRECVSVCVVTAA